MRKKLCIDSLFLDNQAPSVLFVTELKDEIEMRLFCPVDIVANLVHGVERAVGTGHKLPEFFEKTAPLHVEIDFIIHEEGGDVERDVVAQLVEALTHFS